MFQLIFSVNYLSTTNKNNFVTYTIWLKQYLEPWPWKLKFFDFILNI